MENHLSPGETLGKCRIEKILGRGGMGTVYLGFHQGLQSEVAIKVLHKSNEEELSNFFAEAQAIARLEHPNIMKIYDIEHDPERGRHYIVAQMIPGRSLEEIQKEQPRFQPLVSLQIIMEAARGLSYAHQKGIIHRDIKPANLMMDEQGHIKLTDFGLACAVETGEETGANPSLKKISGTPHYMAPEQCLGEKMDARTDLYALGGTFFHLLAGEPPFGTGHTVQELLQCHLSQNPPPLEQINPEVPKIIATCVRKMMARDPAERFQSCQELLSHLEDIRMELDKVKCPRCGKSNTPKEVFRCPRCGTQNLCLSHLVSAKQHCDQCEKMAQEIKQTSLVSQMGQWSEMLWRLYHAESGGMLYVKSGDNSLIFSAVNHGIEMKLRDVTYEQLISSYSIESEEEREIAHREIVQHKFLQALEWQKPTFKFYSMGKETRSMPLLPPHPTSIYIRLNEKAFLSSLMMAYKISRELLLPGGVVAQTANKSVGVLFSESGVLITRTGKDQKTEIVSGEYDAVQIVLDVFQPNACHLLYRAAFAFPTASADALFPLPGRESILDLFRSVSWEELGRFLPDVSHYFRPIPASLKWKALDFWRTSCQLSSAFLWEEWFSLTQSIGMSDISAVLCAIAFTKDAIRSVVGEMVEEMGPSPEKIEAPCLEEALRLSPDNLEMINRLCALAEKEEEVEKASEYLGQMGDIYRYSAQMEQALACYEKALRYAPSDEKARLGLMEMYHSQQNKEMVNKLGLELLPVLRKQGIAGENKLQKVCEILLQVDSGLVECRKELINIHLNRGNTLKAVSEYESLAAFYQKVGNKEQLTQCYQRILKLDSGRHDIREKLEPLVSTSIHILEDEGMELAHAPKTRYRGLIAVAVGTLVLFLGMGQWACEKKANALLSLTHFYLETGLADHAEKSLAEISWPLYLSRVPERKKEAEQEIVRLREKMVGSQNASQDSDKKYLLDLLFKEWQADRTPKYQQALRFCKEIRPYIEDPKLLEYLDEVERRWQEKMSK